MNPLALVLEIKQFIIIIIIIIIIILIVKLEVPEHLNSAL